MVFLSLINCMRLRGRDGFWRKRKVFKLTAHHFGRRRNVFNIALRASQKCLQDAARERNKKPENRRTLWLARVEAACQEHGTSRNVFMEGLARCNVALNHKVLVDIAIFEPRTFKCLIDLAKSKDFFENPKGLNSLLFPPEGVITRGMI